MATTGGLVPLQEVLNLPDGRRIAFGDTISQSSETDDPQIHSGIVGLERRTLTAEEIADMRLVKGAREPAIERRKVGDGLADWLNSANEGEEAVVRMRIRRPVGYIPPRTALEAAIARGEVTTPSEHLDRRREIREQHQAVVADTLRPVVAAIGAANASDIYQGRNLFTIAGTLTTSQLLALVGRDDVQRIELVGTMVDDAATGVEVIAGTQTFQFVDNGWLGIPSGSRVPVGVIEISGVDHDHKIFNDTTNTSSTRIVDMRTCTTSSCTDATSFSTPGWHATAVSGIVLGDLMDGQDSSVTSSTDREQRSGMAQEANLYFWKASTASQTAYDVALDDIANQDNVQILNMSQSNYTTDTNCSGQSVLSADVNDLYDLGILVFKSAGNQNHQSTTDCTVGDPGAAVTAFTVGGHTNTWDAFTGETDVRSGTIWTENSDGSGDGSSRGGTSLSEGKWRSIIDVTAPAIRHWYANASGSYTYGPIAGTSFAAPTITGIAADYIDFYRETYSAAIDDPGLLQANLLLFGDRYVQGNLYGFGRVKTRMWNSAGLDGPYQWGSLETCISDTEEYTYDLNSGNLIDSDVDAIKAVTWYYPRDHESSSDYSDIDLYLQRSSDGSSWTTVSADTNSYEEKGRVVTTGITSQYYWRLKIVGFDVHAGDPSCSGGAIRVYFSFFYEDSDRDDGDGPGTDVETE